MIKLQRIFIGVFIVFLLLPTSGVNAHAYSASFGELKIEGDKIQFTFSIDERSVIESIRIDQDDNQNISQAEAETSKSQIADWLTQNLTFSLDENVIRPQIGYVKVEQRNDKQVVTVSFIHNISGKVHNITFTDQLYLHTKDKTTYTHFLTVHENEKVTEHILKGENRTFSTSIQSTNAKTNTETVWLSFLFLGMEHIITGYDHLLFLLVLLIAKQTFREYIKIVTAFTIAHSITLTLGYLDIIVLPSKFVEAVIALSIVYVALENIIKKEPKHRSLLTFAFGLIHGLGFAGLLSEMNIPKGHLAVSLLNFNIGIEIVQIAIVAVIIPALHYLQKMKGYSKAMHVGSALIIMVGAYWAFERLLG